MGPGRQPVLMGLAHGMTHHPVADHPFNIDVAEYVADNPHVREGLTLEGARWALTGVEAHNWHPVTWWSHMLDVELFGLDPRGHHLTNLLLHAANGVLLFLLLVRLTRRFGPSLAVAALFVAHPLHVESVAWVLERKDGPTRRPCL